MAWYDGWKFVEGRLGAPAITENVTEEKIALGARLKGTHPTYGEGEFIFMKGVASNARGSWNTLNFDDYSTALLAANAIGPVGIAMSPSVASEYGWYQIFGKAVGKVLASFADNANVYATATAGSVDDAVVAGDRVKNAKGASAIATPDAGLAEFEIAYPAMDDGLAA